MGCQTCRAGHPTRRQPTTTRSYTARSMAWQPTTKSSA
nr:MAG TPA: hypothetical protein [Caudoviricetes sp.]